MRVSLLALFLATSISSIGQAQLPKSGAGDWPWWRGPNRNGVAESGQETPVSWSKSENIAWKVPVPGRGHSSPTVVGDRIFLTTADEKANVQSILCFDRGTGKQLWRRDVNEGNFPARIHSKNSHASSTIACDGTRLYAAFLNHDRIHVVALDLDGKPVWEHNTSGYTPDQYKNGYAASPALFGNLVIIAGDFDGAAFLVALDCKTGDEAWNTPRSSNVNYASPIVTDIAGRHQLLLSGGDVVASYDPLSGKELWKTAATSMATAGTIVWDGDLVFASGGFPKPGTFCLRADGSKEIVWENQQKCYEQSLLVVDGFVYAVNDGGIAFCWNAATGEEQWRERLRGPISASPMFSGGHIYVSNERGATWVYRATPEKFELVKKNQLGTAAFATPTLCGNRIYLRVIDTVDGERQGMLYCIGASGGGE
jgi:outer membrane protein assembly factor BamB